MVDNRAARTADQPPEVGTGRTWVSKVVIAGVFVGIIAVIVLFA